MNRCNINTLHSLIGKPVNIHLRTGVTVICVTITGVEKIGRQGNMIYFREHLDEKAIEQKIRRYQIEWVQVLDQLRLEMHQWDI